MKIGLVGAGAIGGWVTARLAAAGEQVHVLARGETLAALRAGGIRLDEAGRTIEAAVAAAGTAQEIGAVDLLILAVKGYSLGAAAEAAAGMIGPDTIVLPMLNGVPWWFLGAEAAPLRSIDPDGRIGALLPRGQVLGSVVHAACRRAEPGRIVHVSGNGIIVGEPDAAETERLGAVAALFRRAGFEVTESAAIRRAIWYKLWGNMTINPVSALTRATADRILDDERVAAFIGQAMNEAAAIGARIGCAIAESAEDRMQVTRKLGAFKTSMLQDAEAGRPLEVEALLGAPCEIAARVGVDVPNLSAVYGLTRLLDQTIRGGC